MKIRNFYTNVKLSAISVYQFFCQKTIDEMIFEAVFLDQRVDWRLDGFIAAG